MPRNSAAEIESVASITASADSLPSLVTTPEAESDLTSTLNSTSNPAASDSETSLTPPLGNPGAPLINQ